MSVAPLGDIPDCGNHMLRTSLEFSLMVWKTSVLGSSLSPKLRTELSFPAFEGSS